MIITFPKSGKIQYLVHSDFSCAPPKNTFLNFRCLSNYTTGNDDGLCDFLAETLIVMQFSHLPLCYDVF